MKRLIFLVFLSISVAWTTTVNAKQIEFKAAAPQAVVVGEPFSIQYILTFIDGSGDGKDIRVAELPDFDLLYGPSIATGSESYYSSTGGSQQKRTTTYTYTYSAKKEGTFKVAAATIKADGANYTSNELSIKVLPPDQAAQAQRQQQGQSSTTISNDDLFVRMIVSKTNPYEQEGILVTFKIYTVVNARFENIKYPSFDGFVINEIELPQPQFVPERYNDRNYNAAVARQVMIYPQRSGELTIDGGQFDAVVRMQSNSRPRSLLEDFLGSYQDVKKILRTNPVKINVKPLPAGKPAGFSGGVGNMKMTSSINTNQLKTNEAVTIKVTISGSGNVRYVKNPEVTFPNDFEIWDPKVTQDSKTTAAGTPGTKTIEYVAIPRYAGDFEIPPITFSYFDLASGTYKSMQSEAYKLQVVKGEGDDAASPVVSNFNNRESVRYLGQDIRYLKTKDISFVSPSEIFYGSFMYILCYLIPAILFIAFFFIYRKQRKENANLALVRTRKANKIAAKRLKLAGKLMQEKKKEEFYDEVLRALWGYLSDKLNIPQANLTKDNVETELIRYGVDDELIHTFIDILNTCEFARYAPSESSDAMDKLYVKTVDAIGKMENTIKK